MNVQTVKKYHKNYEDGERQLQGTEVHWDEEL